MAKKVVIFRGDTFQGTITLRQTDPCGTSTQNVVPITGLDTIELIFPGEVSSVVLSTANPGEITITDPNGTFTYKGDPAKSLLLNTTALNSGALQALDCVLTKASLDVTTFEQVKLLDIKDRQNP